MKEHEIDIYLDGVKTRVDLRKMDYNSLRNLSMKLQRILGDNEYIHEMILESDLYYFRQEISAKAVGALRKHGIITVSELMACSYEQLAEMDALGQKSLSEIVYFIKQLGK
ncbi:DNA-directed RNA polymerase subunit alpha C-terminal domain-containing protein [Sphingobacterium multivorum]|uniref:DNA-directed RNA polymerase subunit alpha C-terminal domain-containing protein n=1 Tax=Sphingobacterium TaxID=28453 RepID=UPI00257B07A8|nr:MULTISPECIES: DNA-directed RNA polymerase subunit alpha C-terminal domain-containing protein [unclassified Sphingobacterium]